MRRAQESPFDRLRQRAWPVVNQWAQSVADDPLPVALQALAVAYKVRAVVFERLLSDTALEREGDGFLICVNTEARGANDKAGTELELARSDLSTLTPPLRFSIAHELAHLIILELSGGRSKSDLFRRHSEALERTCNEMAGAILLPKSRLKREIEGLLFNAPHLKNLCTKFGVSPDVFLLRLRLADMLEELKAFDGLLAVAREDTGAIEITSSMVLEPLARQRWRRVADTRDKLQLEALGLPSDVLRSVCDEEGGVAMKVLLEWRPGMVLPCELTTCRRYSQSLAIMIAIRILGPPETVGT
jgi:hypothetical protein